MQVVRLVWAFLPFVLLGLSALVTLLILAKRSANRRSPNAGAGNGVICRSVKCRHINRRGAQYCASCGTPIDGPKQLPSDDC